MGVLLDAEYELPWESVLDLGLLSQSVLELEWALAMAHGPARARLLVKEWMSAQVWESQQVLGHRKQPERAMPGASARMQSLRVSLLASYRHSSPHGPESQR